MTEQMSLLPGRRRSRSTSAATGAAPTLPVARVALMVGLPHLDRVFDYQVPEDLAESAQPGVRVRVRFAGRLVDGFLLERGDSTEHELTPLKSVLGPPVLTPEIAALARAVADRYAGTLADVLRFAVPTRHARAEGRSSSAVPASPALPASQQPDRQTRAALPAGWGRYTGGSGLLERLVAGDQHTRAVWIAGPGEDSAARVAELVAAAASAGRGSLVVAPDAAAVAEMSDALTRTGVGHGRLTADLGPQARYAEFLRILAGTHRVVVGTRAAVFAPVADLGLIVVWDDADESLEEPQAPGWHVREVAALRASATDAALVVGSTSVSLESARLIESGWAAGISLGRAELRASVPLVQVAADLASFSPATAADRIPSAALTLIRAGLDRGPVLVSVPRGGYVPVLVCQTCREPARCRTCGATLSAAGTRSAPACREHGDAGPWRCPLCAGTALRSAVVGVLRTAEEIGRAFPGVQVVASSGDHVVRRLPASRSPALVLATPGAEPQPGRELYAGLVVLDVAATLSRPGLRVAEESLHRWFAIASWVRPADRGGRVLLVGDAAVREVQALVRWDPLGYASRELAERSALHLAPAVRTATLTGQAMPTGELADAVGAELGTRALRIAGPLPLQGQADRVMWLIAVATADGSALAAALARAQARRSAHKEPVVTVRLDPGR